MSRPTVTRSAIAPGSIRPASGQPRHRVTGGGRRPQQRARGRGGRAPRSQALVELHRARLLEEIDDGVGVGAEGEADAGRRASRAAGADPVGEVALGRRAQAAGRAGVAQEAEVGVGEVGGVDRGEALRQRPRLGRAARSGSRRARRGTPRSRRAARRRGRGAGQPRSLAQAATAAADPGSTARTLWIAAPIRAPAPSLRAPPPAPPSASASPSAKRRWASAGSCPMPPCR